MIESWRMIGRENEGEDGFLKGEDGEKRNE
jgi:hypothetical protein